VIRSNHPLITTVDQSPIGSSINTNLFSTSNYGFNNNNSQLKSESPTDSRISLPTKMADVNIACSYKRPLHDLNSSCDKNHNSNTGIFVTPTYNYSSSHTTIESTTTHLNDDTHKYNECNKRLRYTPEESKLDARPLHSSANTAFPMDAAATVTTTTETSKSPSIPWWVQQRHVSAPPPTRQRSTTTCRICQRRYVRQQNHDTNTPSNDTHFTTTNYTNNISFPNSNGSNNAKTLLSYFPLKSGLTDNDKKPHSIASNIKEQQLPVETKNSNNANSSGIASRCHFCEHDDFCSHCLVQPCTTCSYQFCYFCRTIQQNGDVQCIDCYGDRGSNKTVIENHKEPQKRGQSYDDMDVD
jgi:hypothetical protein